SPATPVPPAALRHVPRLCLHERSGAASGTAAPGRVLPAQRTCSPTTPTPRARPTLLVLREHANGGDANKVRGLADSPWDPPHRSQAPRGDCRLYADRGGVTFQAPTGWAPPRTSEALANRAAWFPRPALQYPGSLMGLLADLASGKLGLVVAPPDHPTIEAE